MSLTALARKLEMSIAGVGYAMENKMKLSDQPVSLGMARLLMGTPDVEKLMARMMYRARS